MVTLTIIRGLPGTGKSTLGKSLVADVHLEADMFFMVDGEYRFDVNKLHQAHSWCLNETIRHLVKGHDVVVSNTFTTMKELNPYLEVAARLQAKVVVYRMTHMYGSIHNVPAETMKKMAARFSDYAGEIIR